MYFHLKSDQVAEALKQEAKQGKNMLEPMSSMFKSAGLKGNLLEDVAVTDNLAEVHKHEADLWFCLEGEAEFTVGGEMVDGYAKKLADGTVDDNEWKSKTISGGDVFTVKPGDWIWIPAGVPHQHQAAGQARLFVFKVPKV